MGLSVSHNCWLGAYSAFKRWREKIAEVAGLPPLNLMEGFYRPGDFLPVWPRLSDEQESDLLRRIGPLPIKWSCLKNRPLLALLNHSDYNGRISWRKCGPLADDIESLLPLLPDEDAGGHIGPWKVKTQKFIDGLRRAHAAHESVTFG